MSDASDVNPAPAKTTELHPLDAMTGGAFSAETPGDRAARIRDWLATQPSVEQLQDVLKELSAKDKSAARAVRERLDEIRRTENQEKISVEWAAKAEALLAATPFNAADAAAWQRDAAKAGAALSREPLSQFKAQLSERVKAVEDLQHRVQVQREVAVLLAQRIEVLSTKSWRDAAGVLENLRADVGRWQEQATELTNDSSWSSVDSRFPPQLDSARDQLILVWEAFQLALSQTQAAAADETAPLPQVLVWADELRVARGLPPEAAAAAEAAKPAAARSSAPAGAAKNKPNAEQVEAAKLALNTALEALTAETAAGQSKADSAAVQAMRAAIKSHGRMADVALVEQVHQALLAAGDSTGWPRGTADKLREELVAKAEALLNRPEGQALGGRKIQETLRSLREQWKLADQGSQANHGLWKKFDEACNAAYKQVEAWHDKLRQDSNQSKAQRLALIEEIKAWGQSIASSTDLKGMARGLRQFAERWRESGHIGEKLFAELQPQFKQAMAAAEAPLHAAQKTSVERRHAMIEEATQLGNAPSLRIDAVKALQQRWQAEAQAVPLDRKHEQKLWDAFRKPLDDAFNRKDTERGARTAVELSEHDKRVLQASKDVEAANASGDAQQIRTALAALDAAIRGQSSAAAPAAPVQAEQTTATEQATADAPATAEVVKPVRPVVAVRGDDRPGMKKEAAATPGARPGDRRDGGRGRDNRDNRSGERDNNRGRTGAGRDFIREDRGPRLADPAFRAQRDAMEHAQETLRKLAAQAHGEALTQLMTAWESRDANQLPSTQQLGSKVSPQVRSNWSQAVSAAPKGDATEALLRLEMAADVPTPADQITARRTMQLQMLTRRNAPSPQETWAQDAAQVLATARDDASARRLQTVLKQLLRK